MSASSNPHKRTKEQQLLFSEASWLPQALPRLDELQPAPNLSAVFDECHNYIYANEGLLKDKIFHEMVKLLVVKLHDEQSAAKGALQFGITAGEYKSLLANVPGGFEKRLGKLFEAVKRKYAGFFSDDASKLQPLTLAYIVGRLQHISLVQTPGDVKGEAFQAFIYRHQRGDRGEFFTPHPIVRLAVEMIAPQPQERVIDPACGSGGFLIQTIAYIQRNNSTLDKTTYIRECARGIEFNPDVALSAMLRLVMEGGAGAEITCANALLENEQLNNTFDVVLTNPPFGNKGKVKDRRILKSYTLARKWGKTVAGDWEITKTVLPGQSPDILFIEKCLKLLRPGGRMAIVLPDGLLQNVSNSPVRFWIRSQAKVLGVVSIPQEAFVPYGTGIKTSLLLLQKLPASNHGECFMARIQKIGYDVKGQPIYKCDDGGKLLRSSAGAQLVDDDIEEIAAAYKRFKQGQFAPADKIYFVLDQQLNSRLDAEHYQPEDQRLIEQLKAGNARRLGEIADILDETDDFRLATDSDIRYIAISEVDARTMQVVSQQVLKAHEAPSRATYRVRQGDIITAVSGASTGTPRQATALITEDEDGAICSNGFAVLRNIHGIEPLFLLAYMRTEYYLRQVRRLMTGHAIPAISIEDLSNVLVPIPSQAEQKKIASAIASIQAMRKEALKTGERVAAEISALVTRIK
jgi:type I restriction enzyme M protein